MRCTLTTLVLLPLALLPLALHGQDLKTASIGDLQLENGQTIRDCKVAYRTFGTLNGQRSNAVLFPTWFSGTSKDLAGLIGPGKLLDSPGSFIITVDALGDGQSSSASNSPLQPRMNFPKFSIRDMVESQHRLLTQVLHISHLRAVMGISMGGMQTFQWITAYPGFMDRAIPIVGSTKLTSYDLLLWNSEEHAIETDPTWMQGNYKTIPRGMSVVADIHALALSSPDDWVAKTTPQEFPAKFAAIEESGGRTFDTNDWLRQLQAMIGHDVFRGYGESPQKAAGAVRAQVLVIVSRHDHMVNPHPALEFAKLIHAQVIELEGTCGHIATGCETAEFAPAITRFLAQ
jgi:homoserine O-acetyltransferase